MRRTSLLAGALSVAACTLAVAGCARGPASADSAPAPAMAAPAAEAGSGSKAASDTGISVLVDRRIELLAIIFRLAGAPEFGMRRAPAYAAAIESFFAPHREHPAVKAVAALRKRGISHDAVMSLAIHSRELPAMGERHPLDRSELEKRWQTDDARTFLELAAQFARETDAERFFAEQQPLYSAAVERMRPLVDAHVDAAWFPAFFGPRPRLIVAVAPGNGTWAYGTRYHAPDGRREAYAIMGIVQADSAGLPIFSQGNANVIVHEFNHSFVNPVVEEMFHSVEAAAREIHRRVAAQMGPQGYSEPRTMISESIVRAAAARYVLAHHGADSARKELQAERLRGFLWIDDVYAELGAYERARDRFPTFRDYAPTIMGYFNDLAPRMDSVLAAFEATRPNVIAMTPANGSQTVDPATSELTFRFDRPMRVAWAIMPGEGGPSMVPPTTSRAFDESGTVLTMKVKLEPDKQYELWFNTEQVTGFRSLDGVPLRPYRVTFRTRR